MTELNLSGCEQVGGETCNPTRRTLQPHAPEAASPCAQVGDEGVSCLAQLCRLKRLDLGGAPLVSQRALLALQAVLPS